jgi:hypothetical protein
MSANAKGGAAKLAAPQGLLCCLTSVIRASPTMTCGIPRTNSMTLFLTQSAAFSLETSAASVLSTMLMVISTPARHRADNS